MSDIDDKTPDVQVVHRRSQHLDSTDSTATNTTIMGAVTQPPSAAGTTNTPTENGINGFAAHSQLFQCAAVDVRPRSHTTEGFPGKEQARHARERTSIARTSSIPLTSILRDPVNPLLKIHRTSQLSFGGAEYCNPAEREPPAQQRPPQRYSITSLQIEIDGNRKTKIALKLALTTAILIVMVLPHAVVKLYSSLETDLSGQSNSLAAYAITKWFRIASVAVLPALIVALNGRLLRRLRSLYHEPAPIMHQKRLSRPSIRSTTSV